jgi:serine/threonine protein kinase
MYKKRRITNLQLQNNKNTRTKYKNRKNSKNSKSNKYTQLKTQHLKGGKFLGEGSFGCVVSPAIPCGIKSLQSSSKSSKTVSKLLLAPTEEDKEELNISNKLKVIDPEQKHFITFEDVCRIKNIPSNRSNTISVEYNDDSLKHYDILDNKQHDKQYCPLDLRLNPINLIMPYGGYDLIKIFNNKNKDIQFLHTRKMLIANFKQCFKNLLVGIYKMHDSRIVNRDIKNENIMANYNTNSKRIDLRFIDFGLSTSLKPEYCKTTRNIDIRGTAGFISPELVIAFNINDNRSFETILKILMKDTKNIIDSFKEYNLTLNFVNFVRELYDRIMTEYKTRDILHTFFGTDKSKFNGYLQKGDIYGLGITMYIFLKNLNKKYAINKLSNTKLHNLLLNMIQLNPDDRYNILQCLNHPYFVDT